MSRLDAFALVAATALVVTLLPPVSAEGGGFVVVVNQANPLDRYPRAEVSKLFLRRSAAWPNGVAAAPCDLSGTSPVRKAFSVEVHGKPVWMVVAFWQQEIASGRSQPPVVYASEPAALESVQKDPGGIAYVGEGVPLGPRVKVLTLEP